MQKWVFCETGNQTFEQFPWSNLQSSKSPKICRCFEIELKRAQGRLKPVLLTALDAFYDRYLPVQEKLVY